MKFPVEVQSIILRYVDPWTAIWIWENLKDAQWNNQELKEQAKEKFPDSKGLLLALERFKVEDLRKYFTQPSNTTLREFIGRQFELEDQRLFKFNRTKRSLSLFEMNELSHFIYDSSRAPRVPKMDDHLLNRIIPEEFLSGNFYRKLKQYKNNFFIISLLLTSSFLLEFGSEEEPDHNVLMFFVFLMQFIGVTSYCNFRNDPDYSLSGIRRNMNDHLLARNDYENSEYDEFMRSQLTEIINRNDFSMSPYVLLLFTRQILMSTYPILSVAMPIIVPCLMLLFFFDESNKMNRHAFAREFLGIDEHDEDLYPMMMGAVTALRVIFGALMFGLGFHMNYRCYSDYFDETESMALASLSAPGFPFFANIAILPARHCVVKTLNFVYNAAERTLPALTRPVRERENLHIA